jgi:chemotaxis protein methyltransferase WspC
MRASPTPQKPAEAIKVDLEEARRLADAGRLEEASAICRTHLSSNGASAQAYYLLGLTRDAAGDPTAVEYYRKALYLEPDHYETLLQMALLSQKNGDPVRARTYKNRAQRLKSKNEADS